MSASAPTAAPEVIFIPDVASTRFYLGALAKLSVLQYFVVEAAVIGAWAGPEPYSRRTGLISDLGALRCGEYAGREVCSPAHLLMNASFVVQGIGMMVGALLLNSAVIGVAASVGARRTDAPGRRPPFAAALTARALSLAAGAGTVVVGLVPEDVGSGWHLAGAIAYFAGGGLALVLVGWLWRARTPLGWFIFACGAVALAALITGGVTRMHVPEPGTLERFMGYPITIGMAALGLVVAQRVGRELRARRGGSGGSLPPAAGAAATGDTRGTTPGTSQPGP